ncbi:hypothetical protein PoB_000044200 [Plakobranchus ocellatus]|uniref:OAR domain-containing protein n=1 Tax=Plakobranchus ocellatus TaxID=259542 RepID=A0AAV3XTP7_9GAST|nr:hypothetical protein PoB_000044200 [Plakobranchus ocellatus]
MCSLKLAGLMHLPTHLGTPLDPCRVSPFLALPPFGSDRLERIPLAPPPPAPPHHHAHPPPHPPTSISTPSCPPHPPPPPTHPFYPYLPLHPGSAAVAAAMATHHALQPMLLFQHHLAALSASLHSSHSHAHMSPGSTCASLQLERLPAGSVPVPAAALLPTAIPAAPSSPSSPSSAKSVSHQHFQSTYLHQNLQKETKTSNKNNNSTSNDKMNVSGKPTNLHTVERMIAPTTIPSTAKVSTSPTSPAPSSPSSPCLSQPRETQHYQSQSSIGIQDLNHLHHNHHHHHHQQHHRSGKGILPPATPNVIRPSKQDSPTSPSSRSSTTTPPPGNMKSSSNNNSNRAATNSSPSNIGCGFKPAKTTSIADLRLKARQHLASLGL